MTLSDNETGKDIINPYITLYSPEGTWVALNTQTFGQEAQHELIWVHDELTQYSLGHRDRLYQVVATVGKQNNAPDYLHRVRYQRNVRAEGAGDALALIPLGYLVEDVVKKRFPRSFEHFEEQRREAEKESTSVTV